LSLSTGESTEELLRKHRPLRAVNATRRIRSPSFEARC
jgi:hypothetical protein